MLHKPQLPSSHNSLHDLQIVLCRRHVQHGGTAWADGRGEGRVVLETVGVCQHHGLLLTLGISHIHTWEGGGEGGEGGEGGGELRYKVQG